MRLQHVIQAVLGEPWLITPEAHASIVRLVETHVLHPHAAVRPDGVDICGSKVESPQMIVADGRAIIPVAGVLARGVTPFERGAGAMDYADVMNDLAEAAASPDVEEIWLDIDSPGGTVNGCVECAAAVAAAAQMKPVFAYSAGLMASAAYYLSAAATGIYAAPSAQIGSIGVMMPWSDTSRMAEAQGVKVEVFASGKYKGMGMPGTSLTPEQRALLMDRVNEMAAQFKSHVLQYRGSVPAEAMEGQTFSGAKAMNVSLVDATFDTLTAAMEAHRTSSE